VSRRLLPLLALALTVAACGGSVAERRGATVMFASGADLQSINPLLTVHPLARQVQRYVLFTTLVQYDSALAPRPYLARRWEWRNERRELLFALEPAVRWHDGRPTTARDVAWTLNAAKDPATGYPRATELAALAAVDVVDDSTVILRFSAPQSRFPDVLTDLAILPSHLLDSVPPVRLRTASFNEAPVGNGPYRFVAHEANRRWVFVANPEFPASLGGRPALERFIIVVVDEPVTKLAALTSGELDFAGIQPGHAEFVRRDERLAVVTYPLLFTYALVFNTRRAPFDDYAQRFAAHRAIDRREIVDGYLYGFGAPADGPVPPGLPGAREAVPAPATPAAVAGKGARFELLTVGSGEAALEQMLQAQLARAGFEARIRQLELSAFLDRTYEARQFDAAVVGVPGDVALAHLVPLTELAGMAAPSDAALAAQLLMDSLPVSFLYHARGLQGMNRRVKGVSMDIRGELATLHQWHVQ
jgi:peptide/nickel transport system substrate-binding protein